MLTHNTVRQVLDVFRFFHDSHEMGESISRSYQYAVRKVAQENRVTYQTIADGCRRRLRLNDISELYHLLGKWTKGDANGLIEQLKNHSFKNTHSLIVSFFQEHQFNRVETRKGADINQQASKPVMFSIELDERDARILRALSEIEGTPPLSILTTLVSKSLRTRMKELAQAY